MSDSIFSPVRPPNRLIPRVVPRAPDTAPPVPAATPATVHTPTTLASSTDAMLLGILDAPLAYGTTAREGFMRKEAALRVAFASLPVPAQRALHARLSNPHAGDELAAKFHHLTAERRTRLLTFLADARRREAQAASR